MSSCCACQHRPAATGRLCWRCRDHLADLVDPNNLGSPFDPARPDDARRHPSIPVLWSALDATPKVSGAAEVAAGGFGSKPPADLGVIELRDRRTCDDTGTARSALGVLGEVTDRLAATLPAANRPPQPGTPAGLCGWLYGQIGPLSETTWVGDGVRRLRYLHLQLRVAVGDAPPMAVGRCTQLVDDDGHLDPAGPWRCAWPLHMPELPPRAPDEPVRGLPAITCGSCGHRYSGWDLVQLGQDGAA